MSSLEGGVAVVTGASRGIGRATAVELAKVGARVVACARTGDAPDGVESYVRCDVAKPDDVERLFTAAEEIGPPEILVCAAGILEKGTFEDTTLDGWQRTLDVNLTGTFLCCKRAFGPMRDAGGGRIVTISSLSGVYATEKFPGLLAYNVSKYGVVGLTEMLAVEGRDHGISAICISPGAVDTEMLRSAAPHLKAGLSAEEAGRLIVALLDKDLAALSGANIPIFSNR